MENLVDLRQRKEQGNWEYREWDDFSGDILNNEDDLVAWLVDAHEVHEFVDWEEQDDGGE